MSVKRRLLLGLVATLVLVFPGTGAARDPGGTSGVFGFGFLKRIPGLWNGPVTSTTPAGDFPVWYVDFRPVSAGHVAQYSTPGADTVNYISFFIVKYEGSLRVAMRTEGVFQKKGCVTYEMIDTVREAQGYYRFSDFRIGDKRAYTEFIFSGNDRLVMNVFTSKFNKFYPLKPHAAWKARRADSTAAAKTAERFAYPQPVMVKDFSHVFDGMAESIYFSFEHDPFPADTHPFVGNLDVKIGLDRRIRAGRRGEICLLLTTQPLFDGLAYVSERLNSIARSAYLPGDATACRFANIHPGRYYLYAYLDVNNDKKHLRGDYMSSDLRHVISIAEGRSVRAETKIDYRIP